MTEAKGIVGSSELFKKELFNEIVRNNGVDNKRGGNPIEEMTYNNKNKLNAELLRKSEAANSKIYNKKYFKSLCYYDFGGRFKLVKMIKNKNDFLFLNEDFKLTKRYLFKLTD